MCVEFSYFDIYFSVGKLQREKKSLFFYFFLSSYRYIYIYSLYIGTYYWSIWCAPANFASCLMVLLGMLSCPRYYCRLIPHFFLIYTLDVLYISLFICYYKIFLFHSFYFLYSILFSRGVKSRNQSTAVKPLKKKPSNARPDADWFRRLDNWMRFVSKAKVAIKLMSLCF